MSSKDMDLLEATVEITKTALPMNSGSWISNPEAVAKFIEIIYAKLKDVEKTK
jgi:protein-L-isoaspartate O-methyltransferase